MDDTRPFGLVHGRIYVGVGDTNDAGQAPDRVPVATGTATFTANIDRVITNTPGSEAIDITGPIAAQINNGALQWNNIDDVPLIANLDLSGNRLGWQWRVDFTGLKYSDPFTGASKPVQLTGWALDVKPYVSGFVDPVTGVNTTVTQITAQAPVTAVAAAVIAKGDPGGIVDLSIGTVGTTTDPAAASAAIVGTSDPLKKQLNLVIPVGTGGGGGGAGTVTKVAGIAPDGTGNVALNPGNIGAATVVDVTTAQSTASNALTAATAAQSAANTAQTTANNTASSLATKADSSALASLAPLSSPALTGNPTAPTQPSTDNDTSIATTAFVKTAVSAASSTGTFGTAMIGWNATTHAWATTRPGAVVGPVSWWSTNDAAATRPADIAIGDPWIRHPDAIG